MAALKLSSLMTLIFCFAFPKSSWAWHIPRNFSAAEKKCMALNIYHEARGEDLEGQIAVGMVTINRLLSPKFPDDICKVVQQTKVAGKNKYHLCQFSWWCDNKTDKPQSSEAWQTAVMLSEMMLSPDSGLVDMTRSALYYLRCDVRPSWVKNLKATTQIGNHCFYAYPNYREARTAGPIPSWTSTAEDNSWEIITARHGLKSEDFVEESPDGGLIYFQFNPLYLAP